MARMAGAEVKGEDAKMRVLVEGNHVHATFLGYYWPPVLGGARSAGLNNPLAGMPRLRRGS